ncbi:MFS transporter [Crossiella sp. NPDC003009]
MSERRDRVAIAVMFTLAGMANGNWSGRIPWVQEALALGPGAMGLALTAPGIGSILGAPVAARLVSRWGSRAVTTGAMCALAVATALVTLSPGLPALVGLLVLLGLSSGVGDIAANANGAEIERGHGRPVLSGLHAMWSVGALLGTATAGAVAAADVPAPPHLAAVGVLTIVVAALAGRFLRAEPPAPRGAPVFAWPGRPVLLIGLIGLSSVFVEAAVANWGAILLIQEMAATPGVAALGFGVFSVALALARLSGDWLVARFDRVVLVRVSTGVGALGLAVLLLGGSVVTGFAGLVLLAAGVALASPLAFSAAGSREQAHDRGRNVAAVAVLRFAGLLAGPALVGAVAQGAGLQAGFGLTGLALAAIALLAHGLRVETGEHAGTRRGR